MRKAGYLSIGLYLIVLGSTIHAMSKDPCIHMVSHGATQVTSQINQVCKNSKFMEF